MVERKGGRKKGGNEGIREGKGGRQQGRQPLSRIDYSEDNYVAMAPY